MPQPWEMDWSQQAQPKPWEQDWSSQQQAPTPPPEQPQAPQPSLLQQFGQNMANTPLTFAHQATEAAKGLWDLRKPETWYKAAEAGTEALQQTYTPTGNTMSDLGHVLESGIMNPAVAPVRAAPAAQGYMGLTRKFLGINKETLPHGQQAIRDIEATGMNPRIGLVNQSPGVALMEQGMASNPITFGFMRKKMAEPVFAAEAKTQQIAKGYGEPGTNFSAGEGVQQGVDRFGDVTIPETADKMYGEGWKLFAPTEPVNMKQTSEALRYGNARIHLKPLAEAIGDPRLKEWAQVIENNGNTLSANDAREFRSYIGSLLEKPQLGPGTIPGGQLKDVRKAMTSDFNVAAAGKSDEALAAFKAADKWYTNALDERDMLNKLSTAAGTPPERVYESTLRDAGIRGGNQTKLALTLSKLNETERGNFASTIISEMGRPTAGAKRLPGSPKDFSSDSLLTKWRGMSDKAKDLIFNGTDKAGWRHEMDRLTGVLDRISTINAVRNTSNTAPTGFAAGMAYLFLRHPKAMVLGAVIQVAGSRLFMSPKFVRWAYKMPDSPDAALLHIRGLRKLGLGDDATRLAAYLTAQVLGNNNVGQ